MKGNRFILGLTVSLLFLMTMLTGCGGQSASTETGDKPASTATGDKPTSGGTNEAAETTVKVTALQGVQEFPLIIMEEQGIAKKRGLKIDKQLVTNPQAQYTALKTPEFQISFGGWPTSSLMREQGFKLNNIYPVMSYSNEILVKNDSSLKSIADLKGMRVGVFGGPSASTTVFFRMEAIRFFNYDPLKQAKLQFGAPSLLAGMLDRGDLDAILVLEPVSTQLLSSGKYRTVGNIGKIWKEKTGENPVFLCVVANQAWAEANPDVVKQFVAAYKESVDYLKSHDDAWPALAKRMGIKTEEGVNLLREVTKEAMVSEWNQNMIDQMYQSFKETKQLFPNIDGIPKAIPEGTFSLQYTP